MANFKPGLVHAPVTPFKADHSIDYETYAKLIEFHLKNGAEAPVSRTPYTPPVIDRLRIVTMLPAAISAKQIEHERSVGNCRIHGAGEK